jgi:hypothetical protein
MIAIWLGIETDEQGRICTATLAGDRPWADHKTQRYRDLQGFKDAWKTEFEGWKFDVTVGMDYFEFARKPSPVADWFTTNKEVEIGYFNFPSLFPYFEDEVRFQAIPDTFHRAYTLALCAYYRGRSHRIANSLVLEVYSLQRRLHRLEEGLNRLAHTIPPSRNDPHGIYCPF